MPVHSNIWVTAKIKNEIADWMYITTRIILEGKG